MIKKHQEWQPLDPSFEFTKELPTHSSAWSGHYFFAYDLVANTKPNLIVELGTHKGNSLFSFAQAIKDLKLKTKLHAIDTWEGDEHAGYYGEEIFEKFYNIKNKYYKNVNIITHKMFFDDAIDKFKDNSIDILHIDGLHTYESVKHDFENWLPKVNKKNGVILLHDVYEKSDDFGVHKLWKELKEKYKTITFEHYHGLGVLILGNRILDEKRINPTMSRAYYPLKSKEIKLKEEIEDKDNHIKNISKKNSVLQKECKKLERLSGLSNIEIGRLKEKASEYENFQKTRIWRCLIIYRKFKKYFKNFFINIKKDGPGLTFKRIFKRIINIVKYRTKIERIIDPYRFWIKKNRVTAKRKKLIQTQLNELEYSPLISIIMPVYNIDVKWIKKAIKSVKKQIYTNWELCIADDASTKPELIEYLKSLGNDPKIKITFRKENGHISEASNSALGLAKGEYIALMDNDDIIYPHALAEVVKVLNKKRNTDLIYSDEDKLTTKGKRVEPFFKPDWSPDLFMSTNYLCHLTVIRKKLVDSVGGFRKGYEGSQDYDLLLRVTEKTSNIEHIADVLYSWRKIPGSTATIYDNKGYTDKASIQALKDAVKRRNIKAEIMKGLFPGSFRVKYCIKGRPLVSIIIPTKDKIEYSYRCILSLLEKTTYENYEILIVDTGSTDKNTLDYYKTLEDNPKIRFLHWDKKFNYSAVNNYGVENAKGEYILLLNNDTEVITPNWIEGMLEHAQRDQIGAVGGKLLYHNNTIQHAGVVLGIGGVSKEESIAGHIMNGFLRDTVGIPYTKDIIRNYSAVTAACLMVSKRKYLEVGGLKEEFRIAFNDVDFNLELRKKGYYNLYTPYVELYHYESISVGRPEDGTRNVREFEKEVKTMQKRWKELIENDPFYNPNLRWDSPDCKIKI